MLVNYNGTVLNKESVKRWVYKVFVASILGQHILLCRKIAPKTIQPYIKQRWSISQWNFSMTLSVGPSVGLLVCRHVCQNFLKCKRAGSLISCSYRSTFSYNETFIHFLRYIAFKINLKVAFFLHFLKMFIIQDGKTSFYLTFIVTQNEDEKFVWIHIAHFYPSNIYLI